MSIRQPRVEWCKPDLGAISQEEKDKGNVQKRRIEIPGASNQVRPRHGLDTLADDLLSGEVNEDGSEQRQGDADAAQDEILPRGFEGLVRPIDPDHQNGAQGSHLDRHPKQADAVRDEREIHREHHALIHAMIESEIDGRQAPILELMPDIARTEDACRKTDEGVEDDEIDIEIIDQQQAVRLRSDPEQ